MADLEVVVRDEEQQLRQVEGCKAAGILLHGCCKVAECGFGAQRVQGGQADTVCKAEQAEAAAGRHQAPDGCRADLAGKSCLQKGRNSLCEGFALP